MGSGATMELGQALIPSILLSETHFNERHQPGALAAAAASVAAGGGCRQLEIMPLPAAADRSAARRVVETHDLSLAVWGTPIMAAEELNPVCGCGGTPRTQRSTARTCSHRSPSAGG